MSVGDNLGACRSDRAAPFFAFGSTHDEISVPADTIPRGRTLISYLDPTLFGGGKAFVIRIPAFLAQERLLDILFGLAKKLSVLVISEKQRTVALLAFDLVRLLGRPHGRKCRWLLVTVRIKLCSASGHGLFPLSVEHHQYNKKDAAISDPYLQTCGD